VDKHQTVLAQTGDNGATWVPAALAGVAVFEAGFVVRELELNAAFPHGHGGTLAFLKPREIPQVSLRVWAGDMAGEFLGAINLQDIAEKPECCGPSTLDVIDTSANVIIPLVVAAPRAEDWEVANGVPQAWSGLGVRRRLEFRKEIPWQVVADADDKLAAALLGNAKLPCVLHLGVDAVA
jgi:hypothetical protein